MALSHNTLIPLCVVMFLTSASLFLALPELGAVLYDRSGTALLPSTTSDRVREWIYLTALSCPQVFTVVGGPLWGAWSDRYGRKSALIVALVGVATCMLLSAYAIRAHEVALLILALALLGIMDGSEVVAQAAVLEASAPARKALDIGLLSACSTLGLVCGPLLGGFLSDTRASRFFSYETPFYVTAGLIAVAIAIVVLYYAGQQQCARPPTGRSASYWQELASGLDLSRVGPVIWCFFLMEVALAVYYERIPLLLQKHDAAPSTVGLFAAYIAVVICFTCAVLVPIVLRTVGEPRVVSYSFGLLLTTGAVLLGEPTTASIWLSGAPLAIGAALIYCVTMRRLSDSTPPEHQGKVAGLAVAVAALAFLFADLVIGGLGSAEAASALIAAAGGVGLYRSVRYPFTDPPVCGA